VRENPVIIPLISYYDKSIKYCTLTCSGMLEPHDTSTTFFRRGSTFPPLMTWHQWPQKGLWLYNAPLRRCRPYSPCILRYNNIMMALYSSTVQMLYHTAARRKTLAKRERIKGSGFRKSTRVSLPSPPPFTAVVCSDSSYHTGTVLL